MALIGRPPRPLAAVWRGPIPTKPLASPASGVERSATRAAAPPERRGECRALDLVRRRLSDLYDECLYGLDAELGRFLRELRAAGRLANTWVVITADHGEHFGEHDRFGHGSSLYNEQTHVRSSSSLRSIPHGTALIGRRAPRSTGRRSCLTPRLAPDAQ